MFTLRTTTPFVRQLATPARRFASTGYGSGATNSDTPNNAVDKEHPGPSKPEAAKNKRSADEKAQQGKNGAQPKILSESPPAKGEESEEVAKHNREMSQRADRPTEGARNEDAEKDKVGKGYWSGTGGKDDKKV